MANRRRSRLPGYSSQLLTCLPPIGVACCPEKKERGQKKARGSSSFPYLCAAGTSRECPQSKYDTHQTTATHAASTGVDRRVSTQAPPGAPAPCRAKPRGRSIGLRVVGICRGSDRVSVDKINWRRSAWHGHCGQSTHQLRTTCTLDRS